MFTRTLCVLQLHPPACTYGLPHLMHMYVVSSIACNADVYLLDDRPPQCCGHRCCKTPLWKVKGRYCIFHVHCFCTVCTTVWCWSHSEQSVYSFCDSRREQWWTVVDSGGQWWTVVDSGEQREATATILAHLWVWYTLCGSSLCITYVGSWN